MIELTEVRKAYGRLADTGLILEGAVPAALLALAAQVLFDGLERRVVPRGLRI